ncbi:MAG: isochorismatase family protein [Phycisphaerales bacterium]|jgi:nicotinamidase/pyrazinamidase
MDKRTIFWDIDTQYDFIVPDGKLYARGAEEIIPVVSDLRAMAIDGGCSIVASMDWHSPNNPEISDQPDFKETFPPHCIAGTPGAQRVGYLGNLPIDVVEIEQQNPGELAELVQKDQFHIAIHKEAISVFSNPNTVNLVESVSPGTIIAFGAVLEFCVQDTLRGLARFPGVQLVLVRDATVTLDPGVEARVYAELQRMGIDVTEFSRLREMSLCG